MILYLRDNYPYQGNKSGIIIPRGLSMASVAGHKKLFPKQKKILTTFGEDLFLAMKRREFTKSLVAERTGLDPKTITKVFNGDPGVAIGAYLKVMAVLGMESNFAEMAGNDELGRKLQDMKLLVKKR